MIREVIATGRDADSAIENGCRELGVSRDQVDFEIISLPKKTMFGLKTHPAKVRVFVELPDIERTPKEEPKPQRQEARPPAQKAPAASRQPHPPPEPRPQEADQAPGAGNKKKKKRKKSPGEGAAPTGGQRPREEDAPRTPMEPREEVTPTAETVARVQRVVTYITGILERLGITQLTITPKYYADSVCLHLEGSGLGVIIGRRGETLDAVQYLASLVANRGEAEYLRLSIDSGNYREKREKTLEALARKLANQAIRTGKSTTLEPMNPYERRIIHGAVSQIKGATSSSVGTDPNRRVVISSTNPRPSGGGQQRSGKGRSGDRDQGHSRDRDRNRSRSQGQGPGSRDRREDRSPRGPVTNPTTAIVDGEVRDLSELTESLHTTLKAPPPPPPRGMGTGAPTPAPAREEEAAPAPQPEPPQEEKRETPAPREDAPSVEEAPRYGKIEL